MNTNFVNENGFAFMSQKGNVYSMQNVNRLLKVYFEGKVSSILLEKVLGEESGPMIMGQREA